MTAESLITRMSELTEGMNIEKVRVGRHPQVRGLKEEPAMQPKKMNITLHTNDNMMESFTPDR